MIQGGSYLPQGNSLNLYNNGSSLQMAQPSTNLNGTLRLAEPFSLQGLQKVAGNLRLAGQGGLLPTANDQPSGGGSYGGYGTGGGGSTYNPNDLAYLNQQESDYNRLLSNTDSFLSSGLQSLNDSFTRETNSANQKRSRALEDYQTQREDSTRQKQDSIGKVDTNARTLSDSLRRMLGLAGGANSSAYKITAPNAVARQASEQRGNVLSTFGENERNIVTSENRAKEDFDNLLAELAQQKAEREGSLRSGIDSQRQGILQSLMEIASQKASLVGGNPLSASQPYRDRYWGLQNAITNYPNQFRTSVTPREIQVNPAKLSDYVVDRQAINANRGEGGQSTYSPYAQFLNRQKEEEQIA